MEPAPEHTIYITPEQSFADARGAPAAAGQPRFPSPGPLSGAAPRLGTGGAASAAPPPQSPAFYSPCSGTPPVGGAPASPNSSSECAARLMAGLAATRRSAREQGMLDVLQERDELLTTLRGIVHEREQVWTERDQAEAERDQAEATLQVVLRERDQAEAGRRTERAKRLAAEATLQTERELRQRAEAHFQTERELRQRAEAVLRALQAEVRPAPRTAPSPPPLPPSPPSRCAGRPLSPAGRPHASLGLPQPFAACPAAGRGPPHASFASPPPPLALRPPLPGGPPSSAPVAQPVSNAARWLAGPGAPVLHGPRGDGSARRPSGARQPDC
eukprot:TRINITY_DN6171_c0_g1_i1.p2 TRINITY_DN6171_c0_g1~~TRINITY_DN6171_c0_g1_i1.p2  ORF type:complete len:353 (+),score=58.12 TRINITY_DN6171_c0_g1_i1:71-1060(+)